jgi:hypothetical protein
MPDGEIDFLAAHLKNHPEGLAIGYNIFIICTIILNFDKLEKVYCLNPYFLP